MTATATAPERQLGRAIRRREDRALLTGAGQYLADLPFADGLEAVFLRSPAAHAEITRLDVTVAAALPGVAAVLTAADLALPPLHPPVENPDAFSPPRPLLAEGVVRFTGEPIAIVLADSAYIGEDALELIDLELEPLPLVLDPREAGSAAPLHDGHGNVLYDHHFDSGGVDDAFAGAAIVFERDFRNPRYSATPMETRGVVAAPHGAGLRLHCSTQAPHRYATIVAELLALDPGDVTVACPTSAEDSARRRTRTRRRSSSRRRRCGPACRCAGSRIARRTCSRRATRETSTCTCASRRTMPGVCSRSTPT